MCDSTQDQTNGAITRTEENVTPICVMNDHADTDGSQNITNGTSQHSETAPIRGPDQQH